MENILAFESADFGLTIALMKDGQVVEDFCSKNLYGQDAELLPEINRMLNHHRVSYFELDLIATTRGPGSFTGLRVALATAEGLSLASDIPAVAFNSLEWVAQDYLSSSHDPRADALLVALESKRKDVYCQLFDLKGGMLKEPVSLLPDRLSSYLENKKAICIGSGRSKLKTNPDSSMLIFPQYDMPTAKDLCFFAKQQVSLFRVYAFPCDPFYLRMPDVTTPKA